MRTYSLFFMLLVFASLPSAGQGIAFRENNWVALLKRAKAENKLVFVDVYTTWCGPCKWMDQHVFTNSTVGQRINTAFLSYKADAEHGEGPTVAQQFGVRAYPTGLFVDGDGQVIHQFVGARPAPQFLAEAERALSEKNDPKPLRVWDGEHHRHRKDPVWMHEYLSKRINYPSLDNADLVEDYLALLPADSLAQPTTLRLLSRTNLRPDGKAFETLFTNRDAAIRTINNSGEDGTARLRESFHRMLLAQLVRAVQIQSRGPLDKALAASARLNQQAPALSEYSSTSLELMYLLQTQRWGKFLSLAKEALDSPERRQTPESLAQLDSVALDAFLKPYRSGQLDSTRNPVAFQKTRKFWQHREANRYAADLELAARDALEQATQPNELAMGLGWATRAIDFGERPNRLATFAQLTHKMGRGAQAMRVMNRALALAEAQGAPGEYLSQLEGERFKMSLTGRSAPTAKP